MHRVPLSHSSSIMALCVCVSCSVAILAFVVNFSVSFTFWSKPSSANESHWLLWPAQLLRGAALALLQPPVPKGYETGKACRQGQFLLIK